MSDPMLGVNQQFGNQANVIGQAVQNIGKKKQSSLISIQVEKIEGGYKGAVVFGKFGLFNKSKKEFATPNIDILIANLGIAVKRGYRLLGPDAQYIATGLAPQARPAPTLAAPVQGQSTTLQAPQYAQIPAPIITSQPSPAEWTLPTSNGLLSFPTQQALNDYVDSLKTKAIPPTPPASVVSGGKFCGGCGLKSSGTKFCTSCGTPI